MVGFGESWVADLEKQVRQKGSVKKTTINKDVLSETNKIDYPVHAVETGLTFDSSGPEEVWFSTVQYSTRRDEVYRTRTVEENWMLSPSCDFALCWSVDQRAAAIALR